MGYSLDLLKQIAHGLAQQFGDSCEIVIHDVRHGIENTILYIENGHVTDRKSGDSASNVVLEAIKADPSTLQDQYAYLTKTNDGRLLKSSTFYIKDESGTLAYIFSINYDITALAAANQFLQSFIQTQNPAEPSASRSATPPDYTQCHRASGYPDRTGYLQYRETGSTDDKRRKNQSGSVFK